MDKATKSLESKSNEKGVSGKKAIGTKNQKSLTGVKAVAIRKPAAKKKPAGKKTYQKGKKGLLHKLKFYSIKIKSCRTVYFEQVLHQQGSEVRNKQKDGGRL